MANQQFPLGREAVLYYNTAEKKIGDTGVETAQAWLDDPATVKAEEVRNLTKDLSSIKADTNTRGNTAGGFNSEKTVLKNMNITFDTPADYSTGFVKQIQAAWETFDTIALAVLNRDKDTLTTGDVLTGHVGNFDVDLTEDQNIDDLQRVNFTISQVTEGASYSKTQV